MNRGTTPKCFYREPNKDKCKHDAIAIIKVRIINPRTIRESRQRWKFCDSHLNLLLNTNISDWVRWYNKKENVYPVDYEYEYMDQFENEMLEI